MIVPALSNRRWTDRLAMDVALLLEGSGSTVDEVLEDNGFEAVDLIKFNQDKQFLQKVRDLRDEVSEKGLTFRVKARQQAEALLDTSWGLIHNPGISAAVKADLIKSTVKWADLEPKKDATEDGSSAGGVTISINLGDQQHSATLKTIEHEDSREDAPA